MRIVFMGTPVFAVESLKALLDAGKNIVGVITVPDKPAGRGQKLQESAVKKFAMEHGLYLLQPLRLKDPTFIEQLKNLNADLQVVVAFKMLPEIVWKMPPKGTINLHASLLPKYRGAAPIQWAIIHGEKETGVTTFFLKHEIDTGNILFQEKVEIPHHYTGKDLHDALMNVGSNLIVKTVTAIETNKYTEIPQSTLDTGSLPMAKKIFKEDCSIEWNKTGEDIHNFIRGLSPYPAAFTTFQGKMLKIFSGQFIPSIISSPPGDVQVIDGKHLYYTCNNGKYEVFDCQLEGKKRMPVSEFLKGVRMS